MTRTDRTCRNRKQAWRALLAGIAVMAAAPAAADTVDAVATVNNWYAALSPGLGDADRAAQISPLVDPAAAIELTDLGITQTGAEFVESLPDWGAAIAGGRIAHRVEADATATSVTAVVCFRFEGNEMLAREVFTLDTVITAMVSTTLSDSCADF